MTEARNRVVEVTRFGGPEGLEVVDAALPTARRGEVRVRVLASSVVYTDVVIRRHLYPQTMYRRPPFVLGYDVCPSSNDLRRSRRLATGGSGSPGLKVRRPAADAASDGFGWCCA